MSSAASLYDQDFVRWAEEQAAAIRSASQSGTNLPLDWENLAEEIESLARSDRRGLRSRLGTVIEHLLKLEYSPAEAPRAGWKITVIRSRSKIREILEDSPSLRAGLTTEIARVKDEAARTAALELEGRGEPGAGVSAKLAGGAYAPEQVLDDWWPDQSA